MRSLIGALLLVAGLTAACDSASSPDTGKVERPQGVDKTSVSEAIAGLSGKIDRSQAGSTAPTATFIDREGKSLKLADFRGRPLLVNLWATWCAPCLAEMPALDRLARSQGDKLAVVTVSQDLEGWRAVDGFFKPGRFQALKPYLDQPNALAVSLGAKGLPITVVYGADGKERFRVNGPLEWDSPEVAALIR